MSVSSLIGALAPAYASDTRVSTFMSLAAGRTSRDRFGSNYEYAVALRVCHLIYCNPATQPGVSGAVVSASEGGVSQSYSISPELVKKYPDLAASPYGRQLADLIEGNIFAQTTGAASVALPQGDDL